MWIYPASAELRGSTWNEERERTAERLVDTITGYAPNFKKSIQQLFWNRPLPELSDYRTPIKGLYLCGAGQHFSGEVTGIPGHNAAHTIISDHR